MPSRSHGKPWASRDWRGLEELTHQLRQLCLCPLGVVQRVQPLMGPDGLSLVCEHGSAPPHTHSHSDFLICSLSGNRMAIFKWNRTGSLLLLCSHAIELLDVNMSNHQTGFKSPSSQLSEKQARSWFEAEREREYVFLVPLPKVGWLGRLLLPSKYKFFLMIPWLHT